MNKKITSDFWSPGTTNRQISDPDNYIKIFYEIQKKGNVYYVNYTSSSRTFKKSLAFDIKPDEVVRKFVKANNELNLKNAIEGKKIQIDSRLKYYVHSVNKDNKNFEFVDDLIDLKEIEKLKS
jgi:hypothetical protein